VDATYVVPSNPPLIVRLAALAKDHAGLMDTDVGEFPTKGDWYGAASSGHTSARARQVLELKLAVSAIWRSTMTGMAT